MMRAHFLSRALLGLTAALVLSHAALASEDLADKNACLNCHAINKKMVGPAFKAIADKYKARSDASAYLVEKIQKGGSGVWGAVAMPAMAQVSKADATSIATWILAQKSQ